MQSHLTQEDVVDYVVVHTYVLRKVAVINGTIRQIVVRRLIKGIESRKVHGLVWAGPAVVVHNDIHHEVLQTQSVRAEC